MEKCPVCKEEVISWRQRIIASIGSEIYCVACNAMLQSIKHPIWAFLRLMIMALPATIAVAFFIGAVENPVGWIGVVIFGVATVFAGAFVPLEPVEFDQTTMRAQVKRILRAARKDK